MDEERAGGADLGRALATPGRGLHQEVDFLGRQVRGQRPALARARAAMSRDQGVVVAQLDLAAGSPDPEPRADETMRRRVIGAIEDDMAIAMELGALPFGELPWRHGQGSQGRPFKIVEDRERNLLRRTVHATAGDLHAPAQEMPIAVVQIPEGATRQRVALDVVNAALFHLPLVLRRPRPTRGDEKAVVLGALAIAAWHLGIVERRVHDRGAQIIEHDPAGHAGEELEGGAMQPPPRLDRLIEDELGVFDAG